jgi:penicillin-binding protein 1A
MEMVLANTIFPNRRFASSAPFIIERVEDTPVLSSFRPSRGATRPAPCDRLPIHTCLAEVLERGTADRAYTELGLKQFHSGKTGTAYNFTDAWFLGYSSEVTCGIWAGFDKPRPIYRGAFSNEVALPVWAK